MTNNNVENIHPSLYDAITSIIVDGAPPKETIMQARWTVID